MENKTEQMDARKVIRHVAFLWILTVSTYLIQPQISIGFGTGMLPKFFLGIPNFILMLVLIYRPSRWLLGISSVLAVFSTLAWHSWIGAIGAWTPWLMMGISWVGLQAEKDRSTLIQVGIVSVTLAECIHRFNLVYLSGLEFSPSGQFSKSFPAEVRDFFSEYASPAAIFWLSLIVLQLLFFFGKKKKIASAIFLFQALLATYLYNVIFYGAFILVALLKFMDPDYLLRWRRNELSWSPMFFYHFLQVAFFVQYLFFKENRILCGALACGVIFMIFLVRAPQGLTEISLGSLNFRAKSFLLLFVASLSLPLATKKSPSPFLATYFSARERRFPPEELLILPKDIVPPCKESSAHIAQRWGMRIIEKDGVCLARTYSFY